MDQKKKIGILVSVLFSLIAHVLFHFSIRTIIFIVIGGLLLYIIITEYFHVRSLDDVIDKGTEVRDKVDEAKMMEATLHHREQLKNNPMPTTNIQSTVTLSPPHLVALDDSLQKICPDVASEDIKK